MNLNSSECRASTSPSECGSKPWPPTNSRIPWQYAKCRAGFEPELLSSRGLHLWSLTCLLHLREHLANGFVGPGAALLPPSFQVVALLFQVGEEVWAAEHRAPRAQHRFHLFKHRPLFAVAVEEKLLVNQPAVHDARHHLPVTEHHAHVRVFLAAGRTHAHQVVRSFHLKVGREPVARFSQLWFAPLLIQPQHQIHLLVRYFCHVSSFGFEFGTDFFATGFTPIFFTTTAANPPVDITPTIISAALAMHAGHINSHPLLRPLSLRHRYVRLSGFCPPLHALVDMLPATRDSFSMVFQNQSKRRVVKSEQCSSIFLAQAILHIRHDRIGHEQGSRNFEQRRPLDGLYNSPEVSIIVTQVAVPPAARPGF